MDARPTAVQVPILPYIIIPPSRIASIPRAYYTARSCGIDNNIYLPMLYETRVWHLSTRILPGFFCTEIYRNNDRPKGTLTFTYNIILLLNQINERVWYLPTYIAIFANESVCTRYDISKCSLFSAANTMTSILRADLVL